MMTNDPSGGIGWHWHWIWLTLASNAGWQGPWNAYGGRRHSLLAFNLVLIHSNCAVLACCFQINDCGDIDIHWNASTVVKTLMHSHAPLPILYLQSHNDNRLFVESALFLSYVSRVAAVNWCLRSIVVNCQVLFQLVLCRLLCRPMPSTFQVSCVD